MHRFTSQAFLTVCLASFTFGCDDRARLQEHALLLKEQPVHADIDGTKSLFESDRFAFSRQAFEIGAEGCPVAHCSSNNQDNAVLPPLTSSARILDTVTKYGGSVVGLGCSSNDSLVACSYGPLPGEDSHGLINLVTYDVDGNVVWQAPGLFEKGLSGLASGSAPLISTEGHVIAADEKQIVRFNRRGRIMWQSDHPSQGLPISPVLMADGSLFVARAGGSMLVYDSANGDLLAEKYLTFEDLPDLKFSTRNTPAISGTRAYVLVELDGIYPSNPSFPLARLYAVDVFKHEKNADQRIRTAWHFDFRGGAGASPTVIGDRVYFDGMGVLDGEEQPTVFGLRDLGDTFEVLFARQDLIVKQSSASFARDPRGGLWVYGRLASDLIRFDEIYGDRLQHIDVADLLEEPDYGPSSALTISGGPSNAVLTLSAKPNDDTIFFAATYVMGIDVSTETATFKIRVGHNVATDTPAGQFPLIRDRNGKTRMFFTTTNKGPFVVGN